MSDMLFKYLQERYKSNFVEKNNETSSGAVVTISRQCACSALDLANDMAVILSAKTNTKWNVISKEILEESAIILKLNSASDLEYIFKNEPKGTLDDILSSFSKKYYYSDKKIRNTIFRVIKKYLAKGNCIIIGRAGVVLTKDIKKSFNIKLQASLDWRLSKLKELKPGSYNELLEYIKDVDAKRSGLRKNFNNNELLDNAYDVVFNVEKLKTRSLAEISVKLMEDKGLLHNYNK